MFDTSIAIPPHLAGESKPSPAQKVSRKSLPGVSEGSRPTGPDPKRVKILVKKTPVLMDTECLGRKLLLTPLATPRIGAGKGT